MTKEAMSVVEDLNSQFYMNLEGYEFTFNPLIYKSDGFEEWIEFMMEYYKKIWPDNEDHIYRRWAVGQVDNAATSLGDYFSRSYYDYRLQRP